MKGYRFLVFISGMFTAVLILSNILSNAKQLAVGPINLPAGTLLFPIAYVFGDLLTEVYGFETSRKIIWTGFVGQVLTAVSVSVVAIWPGADFWHSQAAYDEVLGLVFRVNIASCLAYWAGEFCNSYTVAKLKVACKGKHMWFRFVASTVVGEAVDSIIFFPIAFAGRFPLSDLIALAFYGWAFKVLWEIVALPLTIVIVQWVKRKEHEDHYDYSDKTNFSPLSW